ncbi:hypothetical protein ACFL2T_07845, partial [Elusimicrobiota bacterium]
MVKRVLSGLLCGLLVLPTPALANVIGTSIQGGAASGSQAGVAGAGLNNSNLTGLDVPGLSISLTPAALTLPTLSLTPEITAPPTAGVAPAALSVAPAAVTLPKAAARLKAAPGIAPAADNKSPAILKSLGKAAHGDDGKIEVRRLGSIYTGGSRWQRTVLAEADSLPLGSYYREQLLGQAADGDGAGVLETLRAASKRTTDSAGKKRIRAIEKTLESAPTAEPVARFRRALDRVRELFDKKDYSQAAVMDDIGHPAQF